MLHRPASAPIWSPVRRLTARLGAATSPMSGLLRYVLIAAVLCAIACVYLWQVNELSSIHEETFNLQRQARRLEEKNVTLSIQLAQWNSPAYVEQRSSADAYIAAPLRMITAPEAPEVAAASAGQTTAP